MHPADIHAALRKKRLCQRDIAKSLNVTDETVSSVVLGKRTSRRVKAAIAQATGIPVTKLWPNSKKGSA